MKKKQDKQDDIKLDFSSLTSKDNSLLLTVVRAQFSLETLTQAREILFLFKKFYPTCNNSLGFDESAIKEKMGLFIQDNSVFYSPRKSKNSVLISRFDTCRQAVIFIRQVEKHVLGTNKKIVNKQVGDGVAVQYKYTTEHKETYTVGDVVYVLNSMKHGLYKIISITQYTPKLSKSFFTRTEVSDIKTTTNIQIMPVVDLSVAVKDVYNYARKRNNRRVTQAKKVSTVAVSSIAKVDMLKLCQVFHELQTLINSEANKYQQTDTNS